MLIQEKHTLRGLGLRVADNCAEVMLGPFKPYARTGDGQKVYPITRGALGVFQGLQRVHWMVIRLHSPEFHVPAQTDGVLDGDTLAQAKRTRAIITELSLKGEIQPPIGIGEPIFTFDQLVETACDYIAWLDAFVLNAGDTPIDPVGDLPKLPANIVLTEDQRPEQGYPQSGLSFGAKIAVAILGGVTLALITGKARKKRRS